MRDTIAKLADLKTLLGQTGTSNDATLLQLLARATARAEYLAGRPLARRAAITEYPQGVGLDDQRRIISLNRPPIESITSIKQLYSLGSSDAEFTAADALTENEDYWVVQPDDGGPFNMGRIERINANWYLGARTLQVIYAGGFADPARIAVALATATWTETTKTLTQTGAFAGYTFAAGDAIVITGGTGVSAGMYGVASKTSADAIVLSESISTAGVNLTTGDITSAYLSMIDAPQDLQHGILQQAIAFWNTKDSAGLINVSMGGAGGGWTAAEQQSHPALVDACQRLRRWHI
ncbi:MAG: hypothetical protein IT445_03095 [Phycisphaeraceae bacterium]|nr:hypothetical protein [Phycisphaeraceae bacterium]